MKSAAEENCDPEDTMKLRGSPTFTASLLMIMMNIFRGETVTCPHTSYQVGDDCCPTCPPGMKVLADCNALRSTSCRPCSDGTFMNKRTGMKNCLRCSGCSRVSGLRIKMSCTKKSDTVCEPLEGFYCVASAEDSCAAAKRHKSCKSGQYISVRGTSLRDTECSNCSAGTFSDGTFTSCLPHTQCESLNQQQLKAGTESADAECGELSKGGTAVVAGVSVSILFLGVAAGLLIYCRQRRKRCLSREKTKQRDQPPVPTGNGETGVLMSNMKDQQAVVLKP